MGTHSGPAFKRHSRLWLVALALLPLCLLLVLTITAYAMGLRVQGLSWQNGPTIQQWQWWQDGCMKAQGQQLMIAGWRPVTVRMDRMSLPKCKTPAKPLTPPPWTPPLDITINTLLVPGLPPLSVEACQRKQRWQLKVRHQHSRATAVYDRHSGRWTVHGQVQAVDMAPDLLGTLTISGRGLWLTKRLYGAIRAQGEQLGYKGQSQRSDATLSANLIAKHWQLSATLATPMAIGNGWSLVARKAIQASGNMTGVESLHLDLQAVGPQGTAHLALDTEGTGVASGQGKLTLAGPSLAGQVPLQWSPQGLELSPAVIRLPKGILLSWQLPLMFPLALAGKSPLSAELQYQDLKVTTVDSLLSWSGAEWSWQGQLDLTGKISGHELAGSLPGKIDASGLIVKPASLTIKSPDLTLTVQLPETALRPPRWAAQATFNGRYGEYPLTGRLNAAYEQEHWKGTIEGRSRLLFYTQGGSLDVVAPWYERNGQLLLDTGTRATIAKGLIGTVLAKPINVTTTTPLRLDSRGAFGSMQITGDGIVATRWILPALTGQLTVVGQQGKARLSVPDWQSALGITAALSTRQQKTRVKGTVALTTPLSAAMSRGLGFNLQAGTLNGKGQWHWQDHWQLQGDVTVSGLALDWGGIKATGGNGAAHVDLRQDEVTLSSTGPITLAELNVGTVVRNIRTTAQSDLTTWHFADASADVLGGRLHASALQWPSSQYQSVQISGIDLAEVAALQNDPNPTVQLTGRVGGTLPLQVMTTSLAMEGGSIANEGPLSLRVLPSGGVSAMGKSNRAVELALDTLSNLAIHDLQARLDMKQDGWLDAAVTIKGQNPQKGGLPVVLNYTHRENVFELLRSLRIADEISRQVMDRKPSQDSR